MQKELDVLIKLTKSDSNLSKLLSLDIDMFTINASDKSLIRKNACVEYINYRNIKKREPNGIILNSAASLGEYVIKF